MRVCFFGYDLGVRASGASRFVHDLAGALAERGCRVTIATRATNGPDTRRGIEHLPLRTGRSAAGRLDAPFVGSAITSFLRRRGQFDVLHSVSGWPRFALAARIAGTAAGAPVVHSALGPASAGVWLKGLARVHCTSRANAERLRNAIHIPAFIDVERFRNARAARKPDSGVTVGILGAPDARKGVDVFVRAIAQVARDCPNVAFLLAIAPAQVTTDRHLGRAFDEIMKLLKAEGLIGRVTILGDVDAPVFLSQVDILVFPAQSPEGMVDPPLTVLEAMAAECAVVASRVGSIGEVLTDGVNARLVDAEERGNPAPYAEHIRSLVKDRDLLDRLARHARQDVRRHDVAVMAQRFMDLYAEVLHSGRRRGEEATMPPSDESTRHYYQTAQVVHEYDRTRFRDKGGQVLRSLQEKAFLQALPLKLAPGLRVLDVGCGTGRFLEMIEHTGCHLVGLDASPAMLASAQARVASAEYVLGDVLDIPFPDNAFDLAYSVWVINHLVGYQEALAEIGRVARHVLIAVPNRDSLLRLTPLFKRLGGPALLKKQSAMGISRHAPPPFSTNFAPRQITDVLASHGFDRIHVHRSVVLPLVPNIAAPWYRRLEPWLGPLSSRFGTFMVVSATKKGITESGLRDNQ